MVARLTGVSLGLFAFAVSVTTGLMSRNSVESILSRGLIALLLFCLIGFVLGTAAQAVVAETERQSRAMVRKKYPKDRTEDQALSPSSDQEASTEP